MNTYNHISIINRFYQICSSSNTQDSFMSQHIYYTHHHSTNPNLNDNQSKLDEFFVNLAESQEPLGNDFQKVLSENLFDLYQSSN